ncbi:MAG: GAF domain-containing protein [Aggregatilineales bacterium]
MDENQNRLLRLRRRVEKAMTRMGNMPHSDVTIVDELMHELKVYHVELEIQNEDLRVMQSALESSRQEFEDLFDLAPITYLITDNSGTIRKVNKRATEQFGMSQNDMQSHILAELIAPEDQDSYYLYQQRMIHTQKMLSGEFTFLRQDKSRFHGKIESLVSITPYERTFRLTITDISQQKLLEKRLQGLRELDRAILRLHSANDIINVVLEHMLSLTDCHRVSVLLFKEDRSGIITYSMTQDQSRIEILERNHAEFSQSHISQEYQVLDTVADNSEAILSIPIFQSMKHVGNIWLFAEQLEHFDESVIHVSGEVSLQLGIALQQMALLQQNRNYAATLERRVEQRTKELHEHEQSEHIQRVFAEAMLDIVHGLNSTLDLEEVLDRILINLERMVAFHAANIMLLEDHSGSIAKWRGEIPQHTEDINVIKLLNVPIFQQILQTKQPVTLYYGQQQDISVWDDLYESNTYIGVPIQSDGVIHGIINMFLPKTVSFSPQLLERLEALANHASIAINNASLHQKERELAIVEERQRIARDLHDAVSQGLFTLRIMAESLSQRKKISPERQSEILNDMVNLSRGAQAEMRLLLFELRPSRFEDVDLSDLLEELIIAFRGRKDRQIDLILGENLPTLSVEIKTQLYRIVQEALNNIVKHTKDGNVIVRLEQLDNQLSLRVQDFGEGFHRHAIEKKGGHGLSIMQERAEKIGGELSISSEGNSGTLVKVLLEL